MAVSMDEHFENFRNTNGDSIDPLFHLEEVIDPAEKTLKHSAEIFSKYLFIGLNKCIFEGIFPRIMKIAQVIPIHKESKKGSLSNYRLISNLGNLSKIFEKDIQKSLIRHLGKFSLLTENQFGLRKKKDTAQAPTLQWKTIQSNGPRKQTRWAFFLIFAKLFIQ